MTHPTVTIPKPDAIRERVKKIASTAGEVHEHLISIRAWRRGLEIMDDLVDDTETLVREAKQAEAVLNTVRSGVLNTQRELETVEAKGVRDAEARRQAHEAELARQRQEIDEATTRLAALQAQIAAAEEQHVAVTERLNKRLGAEKVLA